MGIKKRLIIKSNTDIFDEVVIEVDYICDRYFIRVHNNNNKTDDYGYYNFRAFIIYCGDVVVIKNNIVYLRTKHPTDRKCKANKIIKFI